MSISLTSSAFKHGMPIPKRFTGDGVDVSPPLSWSGIPPAAKELVLICDDPDAPTPESWVHWILYKLSPVLEGLPEGLPTMPRIDTPLAAYQGRNSWPSGKQIGYRGPAPPKGHGMHHYHFRLMAIDAHLDLEPGIDKRELLQTISGHVLEEATMIGTYAR